MVVKLIFFKLHSRNEEEEEKEDREGGGEREGKDVR